MLKMKVLNHEIRINPEVSIPEYMFFFWRNKKKYHRIKPNILLKNTSDVSKQTIFFKTVNLRYKSE